LLVELQFAISKQVKSTLTAPDILRMFKR